MRSLVVSIALFTLSSVLASAPAAAQVIEACVNEKGKMRIVSAPTDCNSRETPLSWNTQGPKGAPGPAGAEGPGGPAGAAAPLLVLVDVARQRNSDFSAL